MHSVVMLGSIDIYPAHRLLQVERLLMDILATIQIAAVILIM